MIVYALDYCLLFGVFCFVSFLLLKNNLHHWQVSSYLEVAPQKDLFVFWILKEKTLQKLEMKKRRKQKKRKEKRIEKRIETRKKRKEKREEKRKRKRELTDCFFSCNFKAILEISTEHLQIFSLVLQILKMISFF